VGLGVLCGATPRRASRASVVRAGRRHDRDPCAAELRHKAGEIAPKSAKGTRRVSVPNELRLLLLEHKARTGRLGADLVFGRTATEPLTSTHIRKRELKAWAAVRRRVLLWRVGQPLADRATRAPSQLRLVHARRLHAGADRRLHRALVYIHERPVRDLLGDHEQEPADILDAHLATRTGGNAGDSP
jgi:hypothetical protein